MNASKPTKKLTLAEYVKRRNGVAMSQPGSLSNSLKNAFGAASFSVFWQYWNPIFGYYLGRYIFVPLKQWLPPAAALLVTFIFCGALHDFVTLLARGSFALLFTPWFTLMGILVIIDKAYNINYSRFRWAIRASINLTQIVLCLMPALFFRI